MPKHPVGHWDGQAPPPATAHPRGQQLAVPRHRSSAPGTRNMAGALLQGSCSPSLPLGRGNRPVTRPCLSEHWLWELRGAGLR